MIRAMPSGLFGLGRPDIAGPADPGMPLPPPAYVNGPGGARLTPGMIAQRSQMAQGLMAAGMDTSPVGHWTQGLARVAQSLVGGLQQRRLDKATAANAADSQAALASLGGGGNEQTIAAILANPNLDPGVKDVAKLQWQATHRAPVQPTEFERMVAAAGIQPGTPEYTSIMRQAVTNKANPMQAVPGVDEQGNQILRFIRPSAMGGGDPVSTAPAGGASPPATLPPDFDFGGPTPAASGGFR